MLLSFEFLFDINLIIHNLAIRSGDYYMFDELDDDDDLDLIEETTSPGQDLEEEEQLTRDRRLTLGEVSCRFKIFAICLTKTDWWNYNFGFVWVGFIVA